MQVRLKKVDVRTLMAPGIASIRASWKPILFIQGCFLIFVVLFYAIPSWQKLPENVVALRQRWGLFFTLGSMWIASILVPEIAKWATKHQTARMSWKEILIKLVYFGIVAIAIDLMYIFLTQLLGNSPSLGSVLAKVGFDMLVFSPLLSMPLAVATFLWIDCDFSRDTLRQKIADGEVRKRYFSTLATCWMYFGPVTLAMYSLPLALQYPVAMVADAAWGLIIASVGLRSAE